MTTIAYKHPYIALDSQGTRGDTIINCSVDKIVERSGYYFFFAGSIRFADQFIDCFFSKESAQKWFGLSAFIVTPDSEVYVSNFDDNGDVFEDLVTADEVYAIGSGMEFAMAAMDSGLSAKQAVKVAKKRDPYTGGKVRTFNVETMEVVG